MAPTLFTGAPIFDGEDWHRHAGVLDEDGTVTAIVRPGELPEATDVAPLEGAMLVPGFVDLQVNGGGGVAFNDSPTVEGIDAICSAHRRAGTTAMLMTLISDSPALTGRALAAGRAAREQGVPGFLGLHLEGPHLAPSRKGAHDAAWLRPMGPEDRDALIGARSALEVLMTTLAPESASLPLISALARAGVVVSLGHSDCTFEAATAAFDAGAGMATHVFNAMSPLAARAPGLVGAALARPEIALGLIADGSHVHPASLRIAIAAANGIAPGRAVLVSDAMALAGSRERQMSLGGRKITRDQGTLRLEDGTLAGSCLPMSAGVRFLVEAVGIAPEEALRMASLYPARAVGQQSRHGHLRPGARADMVLLDCRLQVRGVFQGGMSAMGG